MNEKQTNQEVESLAGDIERQVPRDDLGPQTEEAWDALDEDVQQAIADHIADKVADKLERDGHPGAAEYLREAKEMDDFFTEVLGG